MRLAWGLAGAVSLAVGCQAISTAADHLSVPASCNPAGALGLAFPGFLGHALSIGFLALLIALLSAEERGGARAGLILMIGGGLSNAFERIASGCISDYLPFFGFSLFNPADAALLSGAFLYAAFFFQEKRK